MDLNLDSLKSEILSYLDASGFIVFHTAPGGLEGQPMVIWDAERHPDYRMFLETARSASATLICFGSREFETEEMDEVGEHIDELGLPRDEQRDYQTRLRKLRSHTGLTCAIEMAFEHGSRLYVYELQPDWYEEFLNLEEEVMSHFGGLDDDDEDDSLGGFYSNN